MASFIGGIISLTISVICVTAVLIPTIKNTNTSGWSTGEIALFGVASLAAIAGIIYGILGVFGIM